MALRIESTSVTSRRGEARQPQRWQRVWGHPVYFPSTPLPHPYHTLFAVDPTATCEPVMGAVTSATPFCVGVGVGAFRAEWVSGHRRPVRMADAACAPEWRISAFGAGTCTRYLLPACKGAWV